MTRGLQPAEAAQLVRAEARWLEQARVRLRGVRRPRPSRRTEAAR